MRVLKALLIRGGAPRGSVKPPTVLRTPLECISIYFNPVSVKALLPVSLSDPLPAAELGGQHTLGSEPHSFLNSWQGRAQNQRKHKKGNGRQRGNRRGNV